MPSFLSKVFGRKKDDKDSPRSPGSRVSDVSLLDGQFEALTPSALNFPQVENGSGNRRGGRPKEPGLYPFNKSRSRSSSPEPVVSRRAPHLSLHFSTLKDHDAISRALALGVVLEGDDEAQLLLSDKVIGERRLTPTEALSLVRACSQAIIDRGM